MKGHTDMKYLCSMSTLDKNGCTNENEDDLMFHFGPNIKLCSYEHASDFYKILEYNRDNGIEFTRQEQIWMAELDKEMYEHTQRELNYEHLEDLGKRAQSVVEEIARLRQEYRNIQLEHQSAQETHLRVNRYYHWTGHLRDLD